MVVLVVVGVTEVRLECGLGLAGSSYLMRGLVGSLKS